ncbi:hypothetical protein AB0L22_09425 [Micromonospora haikouensis]|uniref:hypothetical protein n=1 Tax=Micromonospora haikouensis TaxID=686309 RepID=UPI003433B21B
MPATIAQTRQPLPADANTRMRVGRCRTCNNRRVEGGSRGVTTPWTRSVEPVHGDQYEVQYHELWCPVWTGETPQVACPHPHCGAPVTEVTYRPGYQVRVPWTSPYGNPGTLVGTLDEIDVGAETFGSETIPDPQFDKADLAPCGHTVEGTQAQQVRGQFQQVLEGRRRRDAEAEIARHADVLAAAETAGHSVLVEQYRQAVIMGSTDRSGLLAALRTLAGAPQK